VKTETLNHRPLFDARRRRLGVEKLAGRPSSRQPQNATAHRAGQKRRLLAAAPEDFSPFAKNTGATF